MYLKTTFIILLCSFTMLTPNLFSQIILQGNVTFTDSALVHNALVEVIDKEDLNRKFTSVTDEQGHYSITIYKAGVDAADAKEPGAFHLLPNYPNPFNPSTRIACELPHPSNVRIEIYNVLGQKIKTVFDGFLTTPIGQFLWDATDDAGRGVSAGVYLCSLAADGTRITRKMLLVDGHSIHTSAIVTPANQSGGPIVLKKQVSNTFLFRVSGDEMATFEEQNLVITADMVFNVTVSRAVKDVDGNAYKIVKIGDQWWMAENLNVTHYRNGDEIPAVTNANEWGTLTTGACCIMQNDPVNADIYGRLYNWYAITDTRNIAPDGWHVPSDEEWKQLEMTLGMSREDADGVSARGTDEGGKMKATGTIEDGTGLWRSPNEGATNESGFSALPGGYNYDGHFYSISEYAIFWSSKESDDGNVWNRILFNTLKTIVRDRTIKESGLSIRCVKDGAPVVLAGIEISPKNPLISTGDTLQFTCMADYSYGSSQDVSDAASWSLAPGIAGSIDEHGQFIAHAMATGTEIVTAEFGDKTAKTIVTVTDSTDSGTVTDIDGNVYRTVKIGDQWWTAENLKVTRYQNGDAVPNVTDLSAWNNLTTGAFCNFYNDPVNADIYGRLYNWYAINDSRNIAPAGWHVPTHEEWQTLINYLGGSNVAGGKLKATGMREDGSGLWYSPNKDATDEYGFSVLPGGSRGNVADFFYLGGRAYFWSSTEEDGSLASLHYLDSYYPNVSQAGYAKENGCSVRCVKDILPTTLTGIQINPKSKIISTGDTLQFTCTAVYSDGSMKAATTATWSLSPGIAGSIDANGQFIAHTTITGTETVTAEYDGKIATATVQIGKNIETGTITDIDGNVYQTVKIGDQWWTAENFKVTHYRNGDEILNLTVDSEWRDTPSGAYCNYDNNPANAEVYGRLYNWYALTDNRNIAPEGWHVPSDAEWQTLVDYLGGELIAGDKLKEAGSAHWGGSATNAGNESGFTALPGGNRTSGGAFAGMKSYALFWSATEDVINSAWIRTLVFDKSSVLRYAYGKHNGYSLRLVKD